MNIKINVLLLLTFLASGQLAAQRGETPAICPLGTFIPVLHGDPIYDETVPPEVVPPNPPTTDLEYRNVTWIHGLGGSAGAWAEAATASQVGPQITSPYFGIFKPRKIVRYTPEYSETSLQTAATDIHNDVIRPMLPASPGGNHDRDFLIGHSQGGLVARYLDKLIAEDAFPTVPNRKVNGIVTFATANGGAQILNSLRDGLIAEYTTNACNALLTPPVVELINDTPLINFFYDPSSGVSSLCSFVGETLAPQFFKDLTVGTTDEFYVGSPILADLNTFDSQIPTVAISGAEYVDGEDQYDPKQLMWRMFYSFGVASSGPAFSKDEDGVLVDVANNRRAAYAEKIAEIEAEIISLNEAQSANCTPLILITPAYLACRAYYDNKINNAEEDLAAYHAGANWMDNADDEWKIIIGALSFDNNTYYVCECWTENGEQENHGVYGNISQGCTQFLSAGNYTSCWEQPVFVPTYRRSDGVVTEPSQLAFPGVDYFLKTEKMNHFQIRNASETAFALEELFKGNLGAFFYTDLK
jgi:pimeloyl-ACP methyl ester carboxylesterase